MKLPATIRWRWMLAGLAIGAIAFFPAALLDAGVNRALPSPWRWAAEGSIWHGRGWLQLQAANPGAAPQSIPLHWSFDPAALLRLRLGWKLTATADRVTGPVRVGLGFTSVELRDTALTLDTNLLSQFAPGLRLLAPRGSAGLSISGNSTLTIAYRDPLNVDGAAELSATGLSLGALAAEPLGNYRVGLIAKGATLEYALIESSGALKLEGRGAVTLAGAREFRFTGLATLAPGFNAEFAARLKAAAPAQADGRLSVNVNTRW